MCAPPVAAFALGTRADDVDVLGDELLGVDEVAAEAAVEVDDVPSGLGLEGSDFGGADTELLLAWGV